MGRLIPAGTGLAYHEERRRARTAALDEAFLSEEEMAADEEVVEAVTDAEVADAVVADAVENADVAASDKEEKQPQQDA